MCWIKELRKRTIESGLIPPWLGHGVFRLLWLLSLEISFKKLLFMCMYTCLYPRSSECCQPPEAGVPGSCKLPDVIAGN